MFWLCCSNSSFFLSFFDPTRGFLKKVTFYQMDILKEVLSPPTMYYLYRRFLFLMLRFHIRIAG